MRIFAGNRMTRSSKNADVLNILFSGVLYLKHHLWQAKSVITVIAFGVIFTKNLHRIHPRCIWWFVTAENPWIGWKAKDAEWMMMQWPLQFRSDILPSHVGFVRTSLLHAQEWGCSGCVLVELLLRWDEDTTLETGQQITSGCRCGYGPL